MMTAEARARAAALMGYLVKTASRVEGRVRLQKSLYLLQRKGAPELRPFAFTYHHYGPYSEGLAALLEESVRAGLIEQVSEQFDDEWQRFEYRPGRALDDYVPLVSEESRGTVADVLAATSEAHWRALELAATVDFLECDGASPQDALRKALELKPACAPFKDEAERVLERLALN